MDLNRDVRPACAVGACLPRLRAVGLERGEKGELSAAGARQLVTRPRRPSGGLTRGAVRELRAQGAVQLVAWLEDGVATGGRDAERLQRLTVSPCHCLVLPRCLSFCLYRRSSLCLCFVFAFPFALAFSFVAFPMLVLVALPRLPGVTLPPMSVPPPRF